MKSGPEQILFDRYIERAHKAGKQIGFSGPLLQAWGESRSSSANQRKEEEQQQLLAGAGNDGILFALDENGKDVSSTDFAKILQHGLDNGVSKACFMIGGPDGHGEQVLKKANHVIRLGKMTWPHQLARVMIAEQLYRAITIMNGHPYHRE